MLPHEAIDKVLDQLRQILQSGRKMSRYLEEKHGWRRKVYEILGGARNVRVAIDGRLVQLATDCKCLRYSFDCGGAPAEKIPLRYTVMAVGEDVKRLYVDNTDQRDVVLEVACSKSDILLEIFPHLVVNEACPLIYETEVGVPIEAAGPGGFQNLPNYVFRYIELSAPVPDNNLTVPIVYNTAPVYVMSGGGVWLPGEGRQLVPGAAWSMPYTSPRQFAAYSGVVDQQLRFVGIYGILNPDRDDSTHKTPPVWESGGID